MFTYGQSVLALIQLVRKLVELGEKHGWIEEGKRQAAVLELQAINRALVIKIKIGHKVDAETDQQVLDGLVADGDIRPDERLPQ